MWFEIGKFGALFQVWGLVHFFRVFRVFRGFYSHNPELLRGFRPLDKIKSICYNVHIILLLKSPPISAGFFAFTTPPRIRLGAK